MERCKNILVALGALNMSAPLKYYELALVAWDKLAQGRGRIFLKRRKADVQKRFFQMREKESKRLKAAHSCFFDTPLPAGVKAGEKVT